MNQNKIRAVAGVTCIFILVIFFIQSNKKVYGNDPDSIKEVINSIEGYENEEFIEIIDIVDVKDMRIVGFLYSDNIGFAEFHKNKNGNYEWRYIEKKGNDCIRISAIPLEKEIRFIIISNAENDKVSKVKMSVNGNVYEKYLKLNKPSLVVFDIERSIDGSYEYDFEYFDQKGNKVENIN